MKLKNSIQKYSGRIPVPNLRLTKYILIWAYYVHVHGTLDLCLNIRCILPMIVQYTLCIYIHCTRMESTIDVVHVHVHVHVHFALFVLLCSYSVIITIFYMQAHWILVLHGYHNFIVTVCFCVCVCMAMHVLVHTCTWRHALHACCACACRLSPCRQCGGATRSRRWASASERSVRQPRARRVGASAARAQRWWSNLCSI